VAQSQTAQITCNQCNAWYDSERELHEHMRAAHREHGSEQDSANIQPREHQTAPEGEGDSGYGGSGEADPGAAVRRVVPAPALKCSRL
jgi:hypothetical protein